MTDTAKIRHACEQISANPNFKIPMADLMPLVVEIDAIFTQHAETESKNVSIVERLRAQIESIEDAEERLAVAKTDMANAFDACLEAQRTLKEAREIGDPSPMAEANTAAQVAQASYELSSSEYNTAEKEYTDLLNAASGLLVSTEAVGEALPEIAEGVQGQSALQGGDHGTQESTEEETEVGAVVAGSVE